jgi:hypothetical protein
VVKHTPRSKKALEKRLKLFQTRGFESDDFLKTKPVDFQAGFEYALKWALGQNADEIDGNGGDSDSAVTSESEV